MTEKQPLQNVQAVAEDHCCAATSSNCFSNNGCMHQPYAFWQALCHAHTSHLQASEELKKRIFPDTDQPIAA